MHAIKYRSILLKLSGEALAGDMPMGIDPAILKDMARLIKMVLDKGVTISVVVGGGNLYRGQALCESQTVDRVTGDYMGMLATVMNGLALRDALKQLGAQARIFSALEIGHLAQGFDRQEALLAQETGEVCLFVAGTGNPFFTTDTAACLRGIEMGVDLILKATKVDGVYDKDPNQHSDAQKYDRLTFSDALDKKLGVMDLTALALCDEHKTPVCVFDMCQKDALMGILEGKNIGTLVHNH